MKVIIAGGGTAGHINPGIAIANKIKEKNPEAEIVFVGTKRGLETDLVPREGYRLELIKVSGFKRKLSIDTIKSIKELFCGLKEARKLLKKENPQIVIGTGGYVCGPVLINAVLMGIPTIIHEQNSFPGVTNKILSRFVDVVAISFENSMKFFKSAKKIVLTGNPLKKELFSINKEQARQKLNILKHEKFIVIFGGSLGASKINNVVCEMLISKKIENCSFLIATGIKHYEEISKKFKLNKLNKIDLKPYIYNMYEVLNAADLVICRSGAITISELAAMGKPSILIPSPFVTANHQEYNARVLSDKGAANLILEKNLNKELLSSLIENSITSHKLDELGKKAKKLGLRDATEKIYIEIVNLIEKNA